MPGNYEFGPFHIDSAERVLRRGETMVALPPKAVDTLLVLLEAEGRVVKKDDILERAWQLHRNDPQGRL